MDLDKINEGLQGGLIGRLGMVFTMVSTSRVEATMPVDEGNCQPLNRLHGGATISLAETVAGIGSFAACTDQEVSFGLQVSANHVSAAHRDDVVRAEGVIVHHGRSTHVWDVNVYSVGTGKLISTIRVTNSIMPKK
ncbi:1,4-dihydroxy-2-naphthoyl-CoA hydrolase [Bacteroidales bacterium]|nr:1,4-dihydroxy-2-naphthoyl-CoA hydrolase [Bacteroidales bacterium]